MRITTDKYLHFGVSAALALCACCFAPVWVSILIVATIGVAKEVYDIFKTNPTGFDYKDLIADAIGIAVGVGLYLLFDWMIPSTEYHSLLAV